MSFQPNKPRLLRLGERVGVLCFDWELDWWVRGILGGSDGSVGFLGSAPERGKDRVWVTPVLEVLSFFKLAAIEESAADQISAADRVSRQVLGSHRLIVFAAE